MRITWGLLGWSNKRPGLEFYRWDDKVIPRHGSEWGDLLVSEDDFGAEEGSPVIVISFDRRTTKEQLIEATAAVKLALDRLPAPAAEETT